MASDAPSSAASDATGDEGEDMEDGLYGFQRRVSANPEQVLRYCHNASSAPLWMGAAGRPKAIPPCARCGAPRWFEFQACTRPSRERFQRSSA